MRETYRVKVIDPYGQAQIGVDLLLDELDVSKLKSLFYTMDTAGLIDKGYTVEVEKQEE